MIVSNALTSPFQVTTPPQKSFHCCLLEKKKTRAGLLFELTCTVWKLNHTLENWKMTASVYTHIETGRWTQMYCVDHSWQGSETPRSCHPAGVVLSLWETWHSCSLTCHTDTSYCWQIEHWTTKIYRQWLLVLHIFHTMFDQRSDLFFWNSCFSYFLVSHHITQ